MSVESLAFLTKLDNLNTLHLACSLSRTEDLLILTKLEKLKSLTLQGFNFEELPFLEIC